MIKYLFTVIVVCLVGIQCSGCHQQDNATAPSPLVEKVFAVNIEPTPQKLQEYLKYHSHVWPEVEAGFKKAGYKKITLYRFNYLIVMTITVPQNADLDKMGKLAESYSPKCAEWNKLMQGYQAGIPGTKPGQTWVGMEPFYSFENK
ncbi:MAG: L-rhamnose mutarotase [Mucilaginibacter sp.]